MTEPMPPAMPVPPTDPTGPPTAVTVPAPVAAPAAPPPAPAVSTARRAMESLDPATFRQTLLVAASIALLFFGSPILNEAMPAIAKDAPGQPVSIGEHATITPLEDWVASELQGGGRRLEKGAVVVDLYPQAATAAGPLATLYRDDVLKGQSTQLTTSELRTVASAGSSGARFEYQGIFAGVQGALEGEVTAYVSGGQGVVADAWSPQGRLGPALSEIHEMLTTLEVRA